MEQLPNHIVMKLLVGKVKPFSKAGSLHIPSAIDKQPVNELTVSTEAIATDENTGNLVHGGPNRVVHHIPFEGYAKMAAELGAKVDAARLTSGGMGENVSTTGLSNHDVCIGDIIAFGTAVLQVCQPRMPCWKLNHRFKFQKASQFIETHRLCGWFYRVLTPGSFSVGDRLVLKTRPHPHLSVHNVYGVLMDSSLSPSIVQEVAECEELDPEWRFVAKMRLENGNKLLKGSGKRLIGAENAYVPDSGARELNALGSSSVYLFNNSHVSPGAVDLYRFDFATKNMTLISNAVGGFGDDNFLSSSVVCGDAVFTSGLNFLRTYQVGYVDLRTGLYSSISTKGLYHSLACAGSGSVIGVASKPDPVFPDTVDWDLNLINVTSQTETLIASLDLTQSCYWMGSDAAFAFTGDGKELWYGCPTGGSNSRSGNILVFDAKSGTQTSSMALPSGQGWPYAVFPPRKSGGSTAAVVLMNGLMQPNNANFYSATVAGGSISLGGARSIGWMIDGGAPPAICSDSTAYVHSSIPEEDDDTFGGPQTLYQFNPYSGAQTGEVALKPLFGTPQIGSLAC